MTWSTRTAVQCTGAPRTPIAAPMHQVSLVAPVASCGSCRFEPVVARHVALLRLRSSAALAAVVVSLAFVVPAALFGAASLAAAAPRCSRPAIRAGPDPVCASARLARSDSTDVRIDMTENDGLDVIVAASGGSVSAPGVPGAAAVRFHQTAGTWEVDTGPGCAGPWSQVSANQTTPTASPVGGLLTLCVASGSPTVHGTLTAVYNSLGQARSVNTLPLEQYVADTVPGESPSSWASLGGSGPAGHELGLPGARGPGGGRPLLRPGQPGRLRRLRRHLRPHLPDLPRHRSTRRATSEAAANDTAGQVMVMPGGQIATTEYSASTGGYTSSSNQQSPFTAVPDDGDAVCVTGACNPNHHWTTSVSYATIQAAWPQIGIVHRFRRRDVGSRPSLRLRVRAGGHHHDQRKRREHHHPRHRVLRRPRPQLGSLHRDAAAVAR